MVKDDELTKLLPEVQRCDIEFQNINYSVTNNGSSNNYSLEKTLDLRKFTFRRTETNSP